MTQDLVKLIMWQFSRDSVQIASTHVNSEDDYSGSDSEEDESVVCKTASSFLIVLLAHSTTRVEHAVLTTGFQLSTALYAQGQHMTCVR